MVGATAAGGFAALFGATAVVGYRHKALPASVAGLCALAAPVQLLGLGTAVTTTGAFAASGVLGGFLPFLTFVVAYLAISITLVRRPGGAQSATG